MAANSRRIQSNQSGVHENLESVVQKHLSSSFRKPVAGHTQDSFNRIRPKVEQALEAGVGLIFDSGCGAAMSTRRLAQQKPGSLVIGIDRSAHRLNKEYNQSLPVNALLVQAECADFWRLALESGWLLEKHAIFYPNPYPKSKHLKRRWHGHPAFPALLGLGGELELRSNWKTYVDEFDLALNLSGVQHHSVESINPQQAMTLFEKKYQASGQTLYRCLAQL